MIRSKALFVAALTLTTTGCLQKETTHTLYLQDAAVTWVASEANVYSDEQDPGKRASEEQGFIGPALLGSHRAALGLQALGPDTLVRTTVVREERPFHVITEAKFARIDTTLERLLVGSGVPARVTLSTEAERSTLRIHFDFSRTSVERDTPAAALLEDIEHFVFVLQEGSFIGGGGFELPDRTRARLAKETFDAIDQAMAARRTLDLTLAWNAASGDSH